MKPVNIGGRSVGAGHECLIIAEIGVNHNGKLELARRLVREAHAAGADVVKFQTFKADRLVACPKENGGGADPATLSHRELLRQMELSESDHRELWNDCKELGISFLSSPFDAPSADLLDRLGVQAFKIASGEMTNTPLLAHVARKGKPIIASTGMCTTDEIKTAVEMMRQAGNEKLILLHCISSYPALPSEANLRAMRTLSETFGVPVGFSDHTEGIEISLAAAAMGACAIEKHFTLDHEMPGPDHRLSLMPMELKEMVRCIRNIESALGHGLPAPTSSEIQTSKMARKSLVAARDIPAGARLAEDMVTAKRPGTGLSPAQRHAVVGRMTLRNIPADTILTQDMFEASSLEENRRLKI